MLDLYILGCALLTVLLELEINSALIRDHAALPIEKSLAFLRLASGRGVLYCAVGLLAIDISKQEKVCATPAMPATPHRPSAAHAHAACRTQLPAHVWRMAHLAAHACGGGEAG